MNSKEYLPLPMLVGAFLEAIAENGGDAGLQFLVPYNYGAEADGQYARVVRAILDRRGYRQCSLVTPVLEELSEKADDIALLQRAILTGDLLYALPRKQREALRPDHILSREELLRLASQLPQAQGRILAAVGTPLSLTGLDEGILSALEEEGNTVRRMPLSEMLWFLWQDNGKAADRSLLAEVGAAMGANSTFSPALGQLFKVAEAHLDGFAGPTAVIVMPRL